MTDPLSTLSKRVRICSHVTRTRFLHVEDALSIGKIRLFAGNYRHGQGMKSHAHHFIDLADARVIFGALAQGEPDFSHKEYKGTPPKNGHTRTNGQASVNGSAVSRVLSVAVKGDNVYLELKSGPGKLTPTGAITPSGKPLAEVNVGFKLYEAQRLAATVLAFIHAWDVLRIMAHHNVVDHQQLVSPPAPYLLVGTEAVVTVNTKPREESLAATPQITPHNGNRPVTRKDPIPRTNSGQAGASARRVIPVAVEAAAEAIYGVGSLHYADGSVVDADSPIEVQAYQRFVAEKKNAPSSKMILQAYYRGHIAT